MGINTMMNPKISLEVMNNGSKTKDNSHSNPNKDKSEKRLWFKGWKETLPNLRQILLMPSEHIKTRNKIKEIASITTFNDLIDACTLTEEDKELLKLHYLQGKDFRYIGDKLGFAESTVKKRHRKALQKLSKIL